MVIIKHNEVLYRYVSNIGLKLNQLVQDATQETNPQVTRLGYLDGWRGIAILLVLIHHFSPIEGINLGRFGVDIFFVLSGMLMSNILFVKKVPLGIFYKRRISRILPVFFIFITLISAASLIFQLSNEHENYFYNLFFIRAYFPSVPDLWNTGIPIGHLWSLNVEEHCYIILSLLTLVPMINNKVYIPLFILGIASILLQYIYISYPDTASENYHLRTEIIASFLLISAAYFLIKKDFEKFIPSWAPIGAFLLATLCYSKYAPHWSAQWSCAPFLLAFTVNHLNIASALIKDWLSSSILRMIGIWSFSIYLWQQPFYYYGTKQSDDLSFINILFFVLSILTGAISFYLIENPLRSYLNKKWSGKLKPVHK